MNSIRSAILLIIYSVTLLSVPVSARSHAYVTPSSENTEKEAVTNSFSEHRESSSIKVTGKLCSARLSGSSVNYRYNSNYFFGLPCMIRPNVVPMYIIHCIYRL